MNMEDKIDKILEIVLDLQARQKQMEIRQQAIKGEIEETAPPVVGSFGSIDSGEK
jgi:hypothetical protein